MSRMVLKARWVLPISSAPVENGRIVVQGGRIVSVGRVGGCDSDTLDFGDAIVLPGFVNAHAHLDLTLLGQRVPFAGSFVGWVEALTLLLPGDDLMGRGALRASIREGVRQSLTAGVTTVGDVGCGKHSIQEWHEAPINTVGFVEVLGIGPRASDDHPRTVERAEQYWELGERLRRAVASESGIPEPMHLGGVSPHAPYSTDALVYRRVLDFVSRSGCRCCTHLSETREETRFLADGEGPLRGLLERRGLWDGRFEVPGTSAVEYAERLGLLDGRCLLVHVNYASDKDLAFIARSGNSVVYCPRSHRFFGHMGHRYQDMQRYGINVGIGTDSLASNASLSILDELRFLYSEQQHLSAGDLLNLGTLAGARALFLEAEVGSLDVGKRADLVVVPLADRQSRYPEEDLLEGEQSVSAVFVAGRQVFSPS